jgi:hypothetical protein
MAKPSFVIFRPRRGCFYPVYYIAVWGEVQAENGKESGYCGRVVFTAQEILAAALSGLLTDSVYGLPKILP